MLNFSQKHKDTAVSMIGILKNAYHLFYKPSGVGIQCCSDIRMTHDVL